MKLMQSIALLAVLFAAPAARASGFFAIPPGSDGDELPARVAVEPAVDVATPGAEAIRNFQAESSLEVTGVLDAATHTRLVAMVHALGLVRSVNEIVEVEGDESAVGALLAATSAGDERARLDAVALLADLRTARSRATLGIVMHSSSLPSVRIAAMRELACYGDETSIYSIALAAESERDALVASVMQDTLDATTIAVETTAVAVELVSDAR